MKSERRLLYDSWWNDRRYRYNMIPFRPAQMTAQELADRCVQARREFYSWSSIAQRARHKVNLRDPWMFMNYLIINAMHQRDVEGRNGLPLGDANWQSNILQSEHAVAAAELLREKQHGPL